MYNQCPKHEFGQLDIFVNITKDYQDPRLFCQECFMEILGKGAKKDDFAPTSKLLSDPLAVYNLKRNDNRIIEKFQNIYLRFLQVKLEQDIKQYEGIIRQLIDQLMEYLKERLIHFNKLSDQIKSFHLSISEVLGQNELKASYGVLIKEKKGPETEEWKKFLSNIENFIQQSNVDANDELQVQYQQLQDQIQNTYLDSKLTDFMKAFQNETNKFLIVYSNNIPIQLFRSINEKLFPRDGFATQLMALMPSRIKNKEFKLQYSIQKDGKDVNNYWTKILNKEHLFILIKLNTNEIIGLYSPTKITNERSWHGDAQNQTMLFSVTKNQIFPIKKENSGYVFHLNRASHLLQFGYNQAIYIKVDFTLPQSNLSGFDLSHINPRVNNATHLYGATTATITEYEVYCIQ